MTGLDLTALGEHEDVDTLGGLAAAFAGRVPIRGEVVASPDGDFEFDILDADPRRLKRLKLRRIEPGRPTQAAAGESLSRNPSSLPFSVRFSTPLDLFKASAPPFLRGTSFKIERQFDARHAGKANVRDSLSTSFSPMPGGGV